MSRSCPLRTSYRRQFQDHACLSKSISWEVEPGQPYCLSALESLAQYLQDPDVDMWRCLHEGVPTGFHQDIPPSNVFVPTGDDPFIPPELITCEGNWSGAEKEPELFRSLVQQEVSEGWLQQVGSLQQAEERWPSMTAVGKCSVVQAPGRKPRLVDASISNANASCLVPERYSLQIPKSGGTPF